MNPTTENLPCANPACDLPRAATRPAATKGGFFQTLILKAFEPMQLGCLSLRLPDGSERLFGTPGAEISAHIRVVNPDFFKRCVLYGDIGFGEAYVDGDWATDDITKVIAWFILNVENSPSMSGSKQKKWGVNLLRGLNRLGHLLRPNSVSTSQRNIAEHYDLGNDFYRLWLDPTMTYSSAYFASPELTLEQAQIAKYDRLCQKLQLRPADHVLEIGSGWGGFSCHAAKNYGCRITTVTISAEQFKYARKRFAHEGVADRVEIKEQDYRRITGRFDKIASIEMLEAVGDRYLETYFAKCHEVLKPDGLLGLQYITCPDNRYDLLRRDVDWIQKHIFPGSLLLSVSRVNQALNRTGELQLFDLADLGPHYARTLREWFVRFNTSLETVRAQGFSEQFLRKWNYYLCYCEAAFALRNISLVQAVYTRPNNSGLANI